MKKKHIVMSILFIAILVFALFPTEFNRSYQTTYSGILWAEEADETLSDAVITIDGTIHYRFFQPDYFIGYLQITVNGSDLIIYPSETTVAHIPLDSGMSYALQRETYFDAYRQTDLQYIGALFFSKPFRQISIFLNDAQIWFTGPAADLEEAGILHNKLISSVDS